MCFAHVYMCATRVSWHPQKSDGGIESLELESLCGFREPETSAGAAVRLATSPSPLLFIPNTAMNHLHNKNGKNVSEGR